MDYLQKPALTKWTDPELIDLDKSMDSIEATPGSALDMLGSDS